MNKSDLLRVPVEHFDIKRHNVVPLVEAMERMAFQARNLHRAAAIVDQMLRDDDCIVFLTLAGSLVSAGLKQVVVDLVEHHMVDAIVATGANIVDQDFFEALGFRHYLGSPRADDDTLRDLMIDRIYDTYIDEDELRVCDFTVSKICEMLEPRPYSSREFIHEMGAYLMREGCGVPSIVESCHRREVPIFVPALSDSSAGFGLIHHQSTHPGQHVTLDSARDFLELTECKLSAPQSGLLMIGGGVPKNFVQDTVVAAEILNRPAEMHKYAVQITVADERDGGLSGSTLREASSWGKVATSCEQMVYAEATLALPLVAGYAFHRGAWTNRRPRRLNQLFTVVGQAPSA